MVGGPAEHPRVGDGEGAEEHAADRGDGEDPRLALDRHPQDGEAVARGRARAPPSGLTATPPLSSATLTGAGGACPVTGSSRWTTTVFPGTDAPPIAAGRYDRRNGEPPLHAAERLALCDLLSRSVRTHRPSPGLDDDGPRRPPGGSGVLTAPDARPRRGPLSGLTDHERAAGRGAHFPVLVERCAAARSRRTRSGRSTGWRTRWSTSCTTRTSAAPRRAGAARPRPGRRRERRVARAAGIGRGHGPGPGSGADRARGSPSRRHWRGSDPADHQGRTPGPGARQAERAGPVRLAAGRASARRAGTPDRFDRPRPIKPALARWRAGASGHGWSAGWSRSRGAR